MFHKYFCQNYLHQTVFDQVSLRSTLSIVKTGIPRYKFWMLENQLQTTPNSDLASQLPLRITPT